MNTRSILKTLIVLTFLYSRFTFYADAYPKIEYEKEGPIKKAVHLLKDSADFLRNINLSKYVFPPDKSTLQKIEDYILKMPGMTAIVDEAKKIYKDSFQTTFLTELYRGVFSKADMLNVGQHVSMMALVYDTIIFGTLMCFVYTNSGFANVMLLGDSLYKMFLLLMYHFRETPFERMTNYILSFFTDLRTFNILAMWKTNMDVLHDHRSVIATFAYGLLLFAYLYMYGEKIKIPAAIHKHMPTATTTTTTVGKDIPMTSTGTSRVGEFRETTRH
jgi:hypothetical protein